MLTAKIYDHKLKFDPEKHEVGAVCRALVACSMILKSDEYKTYTYGQIIKNAFQVFGLARTSSIKRKAHELTSVENKYNELDLLGDELLNLLEWEGELDTFNDDIEHLLTIGWGGDHTFIEVAYKMAVEMCESSIFGCDSEHVIQAWLSEKDVGTDWHSIIDDCVFHGDDYDTEEYLWEQVQDSYTADETVWEYVDREGMIDYMSGDYEIIQHQDENYLFSAY